MSPYTTPSAAMTSAEPRFAFEWSVLMQTRRLLRCGGGTSREGRPQGRVELAEHFDSMLVALSHDLIETGPLQQPDLVQRRAEVHVRLPARLVLPRHAVKDGDVQQVRGQRWQPIAPLVVRPEAIAQQCPASGHLVEVELARMPRTEVDTQHLADPAQVAHQVHGKVVERAAVAEQ